MIIDPKDQKKPLLYYFFQIESFKRVSEIAASLFGFGSAFFILRSLSVYEFGAYQLVLSLIAIAGSFNFMEVFDGIVMLDMRRYFNKGERDLSKKIFLENAILKLGLSLIITAAVFGGADLIARYYDPSIGLYIKIASILLISATILSIERTFLKSVFSVAHWSFAALKELMRLLLIITVVVWFGEVDLTRVIIAHVAADVIVLLGVTAFLFLKLFRQAFFGVTAYSKSLMLEIVRSFGKLSILRFIASKTTGNAIPWFIKALVNTEGVALYTLARGVLDALGGLMPTSGTSELMALKAHDEQTLTRVFKRSIKYSFWLGLILMVVGQTFMPPILVAFFPAYAPAMPLVRVMLLVLPIFGIYKVLKSTVAVLREIEIMMKKALNEVWVILIGTPILLYFFGIIGSALVFLVLYAERILYFYPKLIKKHPYLKINAWNIVTVDSSDKQFILGAFKYGLSMAKSLFKRK